MRNRPVRRLFRNPERKGGQILHNQNEAYSGILPDHDYSVDHGPYCEIGSVLKAACKAMMDALKKPDGTFMTYERPWPPKSPHASTAPTIPRAASATRKQDWARRSSIACTPSTWPRFPWSRFARPGPTRPGNAYPGIWGNDARKLSQSAHDAIRHKAVKAVIITIRY